MGGGRWAVDGVEHVSPDDRPGIPTYLNLPTGKLFAVHILLSDCSVFRSWSTALTASQLDAIITTVQVSWPAFFDNWTFVGPAALSTKTLFLHFDVEVQWANRLHVCDTALVLTASPHWALVSNRTCC